MRPSANMLYLKYPLCAPPTAESNAIFPFWRPGPGPIRRYALYSLYEKKNIEISTKFVLLTRYQNISVHLLINTKIKEAKTKGTHVFPSFEIGHK